MLAYLAWAMRHEEPPGRDERKTCRVLKEWFERYEFEYDPHVALGWLLDTPWLHREGNLIVFRHPYIMDTLTAMEWKTRFMEEGGETALGYVASVMPRPEWQEVVILLAGMLDCEMASLLTESLMDQNLMDLAARCIVAGTNVKRTTLARVIRALLAPHTEGEQR